MSKHIFALYKENLNNIINLVNNSPDFISFKDKILYNRLTKVIRIKDSNQFILFDNKININIKATEEFFKNKNIVSGKIIKKELNISLKPEITLLLPVLKKEAFEYAIYLSGEIGVTKIVPIITEKSLRPKNLNKIYDRLNKILISSCEQAKNFSIPIIEMGENSISLESFLEKQNNKQNNIKKICFDEHGENFLKLYNNINTLNNIIITVGPEGGFSDKEINILKNNNFKFYRLTKTILRSKEALCLGLGILRSVT